MDVNLLKLLLLELLGLGLPAIMLERDAGSDSLCLIFRAWWFVLGSKSMNDDGV